MKIKLSIATASFLFLMNNSVMAETMPQKEIDDAELAGNNNVLINADVNDNGTGAIYIGFDQTKVDYQEPVDPNDLDGPWQNVYSSIGTTAIKITTTGMTVYDNISVEGNSTLGNSSTDTTTINGLLDVNNNLNVDGTVTVDGNTTLGDASTDTTTINGLLDVNNNLNVDGTNTVKGNSTLGDSSEDSTTINGLLDVNNNLNVDGTNTVKGNSTLGDSSEDSTTVNGLLDVNDNLNVDGNSTLGTLGSSTNEILGSQNIISGQQTTENESASVSLTGQNGSVEMISATSVDNGLYSGVYIQGSASTDGAYDVYIASQNGEAAIGINNNGVNIISPIVNEGEVASNNFGANNSSGTIINSIGSGTGTTTNNMGNSNANTTVNLQASNSSSNLGNGVATTQVESGYGVGESIFNDASSNTSAYNSIVLKDAEGTYTSVDANGQLTTITGTASQTSASLVVTNGYDNVHGFYVDETQATISGGTTSSSLTLNNDGATFGNSDTGRPIQVHGVADGTADFDAINVRQLNRSISSVAAMSNMPAIEPGKKFALSIGYGNHNDTSAYALGAQYRINTDVTLKASAAQSSDGGDSTFGAGVSWSW